MTYSPNDDLVDIPLTELRRYVVLDCLLKTTAPVQNLRTLEHPGNGS
ncbi:MAG: hypothetical protein P4L78_09710 [Silvimonas sp.]|nr:hypothetical protein [Silvimonas sp.]